MADTLPIEAEVITKELLETALENYHRCDDVVVDEFVIDTPLKPGDNYYSVVLSIDVDYRAKDDPGQRQHLIAKVSSTGNPLLKQLQRQCHLFAKEILMYQQVIPAVENLLTSSTTENLQLPVVRHCFSSSDEKRDVILIENVAWQGYTMTHPRDGFSLDQCMLAVKAYGMLNATTYALDEKHAGGLMNADKFSLFIKESYLSPDFMIEQQQSLHRRGLKISAQLFTEHVLAFGELTEDKRRLIARAKQLPEINYTQVMRSFLKSDSRFATIGHADSSGTNFLFKRNDFGEVIDVKVIDFQFVRFAVPTVDLSMVIHQVTTPELRKRHLDELLDEYYKSLTGTLSSLSTSLPWLSKDAFRSLWSETRGYGVLTGLALLPFFLLDPCDTVNIFNCSDDPDGIKAACRVFTDDTKRGRIVSLMYEAFECGFI